MAADGPPMIADGFPEIEAGRGSRATASKPLQCHHGHVALEMSLVRESHRRHLRALLSAAIGVKHFQRAKPLQRHHGHVALEMS
jgi:hypothetical protein